MRLSKYTSKLKLNRQGTCKKRKMVMVQNSVVLQLRFHVMINNHIKKMILNEVQLDVNTDKLDS